jgi:hypothetical protein
LGILIFSIVIVALLYFFRTYGLRYYEKIEREADRKANIAKASAPVKAKVDNSLETEITPVILAAVAATLHSAVKVKKIQFVGQKDSQQWSQTGRIQALNSHWISVPRTYKY